MKLCSQLSEAREAKAQLQRGPGAAAFPSTSAALLLGKTRVEARYPEGTAPQMSPPRPQHAELTLAGTLLVTVAKRSKWSESLLLRGSTWKPEVTLPQFIGQCKYHGQPEFRSGVRGLEDPITVCRTPPQRQSFSGCPCLMGPYRSLFCVYVCGCTCGSQRTALSIISWVPSILRFETRSQIWSSPVSMADCPGNSPDPFVLPAQCLH